MHATAVLAAAPPMRSFEEAANIATPDRRSASAGSAARPAEMKIIFGIALLKVWKIRSRDFVKRPDEAAAVPK
jgi:hypothetical protein